MADSASGALDHLVETITDEGQIDMREAAKLYGSRGHKSTPTRHATKGVRLPDGTTLFLEAIRVGGKLKTSRQAVLRFFAAQTKAAAAAPAESPRTPRQRNKAAEQAAAELDALGVV